MSENYDTLLTLEIQYEFISTTLFLIFYRYVRVRNLLQGYELQQRTHSTRPIIKFQEKRMCNGKAYKLGMNF